MMFVKKDVSLFSSLQTSFKELGRITEQYWDVENHVILKNTLLQKLTYTQGSRISFNVLTESCTEIAVLGLKCSGIVLILTQFLRF